MIECYNLTVEEDEDPHNINIKEHSSLKYLVNKPILGGKIYRWLLLFQEYEFEVIVKPRRLNVGPDIKVIDDHFMDIIQFLSTGMVPMEHTTKQNKELVVGATNFSLIEGHLYKMGPDEVLHIYVPKP